MLFLAIFKVLTFMMSFIGMLFVVRILTPADFGIYTTFLFLVPFISQLVTLSNYEYMLRELPAEEDEKRRAEILFSSLIIPVAIVVPVLAVDLLVFGSYTFFFAYLLAVLIYEFFNRFSISRGNRYQVAVNDFFLNAGWVALYLVIVNSAFFDGDGVSQLFLSRIISVTIAIAIFVVIQTRTISLARINFDISKKTVRFGVSVVVASLCYSAFLAIDRFLLSWLAGPSEAGLYSFIQVPFNALLSFFTATIFVGTIAKIRKEKYENGTSSLLTKVVEVSGYIFFPAFVFAGIHFEVYAETVGSGKYSVGQVLAFTAGLSKCFFLQILLLRQDCISSGRGGSVSRIYLTSFVLYVALAIAIYPLFGAAGAVILNLVLYSLLSLSLLKLARIPVRRVITISGVSVVISVICGVVAEQVSAYVHGLFDPGSTQLLVHLLIILSGLGLAYLGLVLVKVINLNDMKIVLRG